MSIVTFLIEKNVPKLPGTFPSFFVIDTLKL